MLSFLEEKERKRTMPFSKSSKEKMTAKKIAKQLRHVLSLLFCRTPYNPPTDPRQSDYCHAFEAPMIFPTITFFPYTLRRDNVPTSHLYNGMLCNCCRCECNAYKTYYDNLSSENHRNLIDIMKDTELINDGMKKWLLQFVMNIDIYNISTIDVTVNITPKLRSRRSILLRLVHYLQIINDISVATDLEKEYAKCSYAKARIILKRVDQDFYDKLFPTYLLLPGSRCEDEMKLS